MIRRKYSWKFYREKNKETRYIVYFWQWFKNHFFSWIGLITGGLTVSLIGSMADSTKKNSTSSGGIRRPSSCIHSKNVQFSMEIFCFFNRLMKFNYTSPINRFELSSTRFLKKPSALICSKNYNKISHYWTAIVLSSLCNRFEPVFNRGVHGSDWIGFGLKPNLTH